jgi:hypothetical protein
MAVLLRKTTAAALLNIAAKQRQSMAVWLCKTATAALLSLAAKEK